MPDAERYPFDFDSLDKGDRIEAPTLEHLFGVAATSAEFSGKQVAMASEIEAQLADRGKEIAVVCRGTEIHLLTDSEASEHLTNLFGKGRRMLSRAHRKMMTVNTGYLSPDERKAHDRGLVVQGAILAGMISARKAISTVHQRNTPGLPSPEPTE